MHRTDLINRTSGLLVFIIICLVLAFFPKTTSDEKVIYEAYDPQVTEQEINYYLVNDIIVDKADQLNEQKAQNWVQLQAQVGQLKSSLDFFKRLNIQKIIQKHELLSQKVSSCRSLKFNEQLEVLKDFNKTITDKSNPQEQLTNLEFDKDRLNKEILYIKGQFADLKNAESTLKQSYQEVINDFTSKIKLQNRNNSLIKLNNTIQREKYELSNLKKRIEEKSSQGQDEDLSQYYRYDQEQAKLLGELFKPASTTKPVDLKDEKLFDFVKKFNDGISNFGKPTEEFYNGLNFNPEIKKNDLEELNQEYLKKLRMIETMEQQQTELLQEIDGLAKDVQREDNNLKNITKQLEENRYKQQKLEKEQAEHQTNITQILNKIKNLGPMNKDESDYRTESYKKIQDYLDSNIEQDQQCFEDCIAYDTLQHQLGQGNYVMQLNGIEKHYTQLDEVLFEINI